MSCTILKSGIHSTLQDLGRWGYQQYGIPISGAMDEFAARKANIICGNDDHEAVMEITLHGTEILFNEPACISVTGSGSRIFINDTEVEYNKLIKLEAFCTLKFKSAPTGCRSYLAVQGGLDVKKEMDSASTYVTSSIGGINGDKLKTGDIILFSRNKPMHKKGDQIKIEKNGFGSSTWKAADPIDQQTNDAIKINLCAGPEWDLFQTESQESIFNTTYSISLKANRMGIHLEGRKLELKEKKEMLSSAVTRGIVQVTNEGLPIILMADAQTTGGYPRIARVCSADLSLLAQCRPGDRVMFNKISAAESMRLLAEKKKLIQQIKIALN